MTPSFRCPHCTAPLTESLISFRCESGHAFDRAKEGYVNLLPGGRLKGRRAGDDDEMVRARRQIFDSGLYRPIINRIAALTAEVSPRFILDSGCGEGTYLAAATYLAEASGWGIDISRSAVQLAARRTAEHRYAVASSYALPFQDELFDVVLSVFAPRDLTEMRRVLRPAGIAIVVTPGPDHLRELKDSIYDDARPHSAADPHDQPPDCKEPVSFVAPLADPTQRLALLHMTPFWWSTSAERREEIAVSLTTVTIDMRVSTYRR